MQVLVTGVTGFAGGRLSGHLVESGHAVRGLVRPASRGKLADLERTVEAVDGDLDDPASLARACAGVEVVYETSGSDDIVVVVGTDDTDELNAIDRKSVV